jgi:hypothetical protein
MNSFKDQRLWQRRMPPCMHPLCECMVSILEKRRLDECWNCLENPTLFIRLKGLRQIGLNCLQQCMER